MINIIEYLSESIRFLPKSDEMFLPGKIAQLIEIDGIPKCTISDGTRPFGIIGNLPKQPFGLIPIWYESMILETDVYEPGLYNPGDCLYVSKNGLLTSKKLFEWSHLVAHVISTGAKNEAMQISWI